MGCLRILILMAAGAVAVLCLGRTDACGAEPGGTAAVFDAAAPKVCLVIVEDSLGLPLAYASGFLVGTGGWVVTDLASVAQPGAKQISLRFRDGTRDVAKSFVWAEPAAGAVLLRAEGKATKLPGLSLSTASTAASSDVTLVGWKWAQEVESVAGRLTNGVAAATLASSLKIDAPSGAITFLKLLSDRPDMAGGAPVLDSSGGVVGALFQVAGTDKALVIPSSRFRSVLLAEPDPKPLSELPKPFWPVAVERLPGKPVAPADFMQALQAIRDRSLCPKCGGKGHLIIQKTIPAPAASPPSKAASGAKAAPAAAAPKPIIRVEEETCPVCKGEGIVFGERLYAQFETLAASGSRLMVAPETDAKGRESLVGGVGVLLKSLARVDPVYRGEMARQAQNDLAKGTYPRGVLVLARLARWYEGPEGRFTLLETEALDGFLAIKADALAAGEGGKGDKPAEGQWILLAGMAMGPVTLGDNRPILVRPLAWTSGPAGKAPVANPPVSAPPPVVDPPPILHPTRPPKTPSVEPNFFGL
jgi:hypothetical protein